MKKTSKRRNVETSKWQCDSVPASGLTLREAPTIRDLTARSLTLRVESLDTEKRSVEAVLATGAWATVFDFRRFEIIDEILRIDGAVLPEQVPLLESHYRWSMDSLWGSTRNLRIEGGQVVGRLFYAKGDERAEAAWLKTQQGHLTDVSVGYRSDEYVDIEPGDTRTVGGTEYKAGNRPLRITTKWTLREVSLVTIGADEAAKIRADMGMGAGGTPVLDNQAGHRPAQGMESSDMNETLRTYLVSLGMRADANDATARAFMEALDGARRHEAETLLTREDVSTTTGAEQSAAAAGQTDTERTDAGNSGGGSATATLEQRSTELPEVALDAVRAEARTAERSRIADLRQLAGTDVSEETIRRGIEEGWTREQAAPVYLAELRRGRTEPVGSTGSGGGGGLPGIHSRSHDVDCTRDALAAGLMIRAGLQMVDPNASAERRELQARTAELGERYRDVCMLDMCREAVRLSGGRIPHGRDETIRAAVSTAELSYIFTTSVNAVLMRTYEQAPDSTDGWCSQADVPDFKTNKRIRLGQTGRMERLARGDTAKHATRADNQEEYSVVRYAKQFVIDEQDIVDDRMNALMEMPQQMGQAARRLRPDLVYSILLANAALADSVALYHGTHVNLGEASTALAAGTLQAGVAAMAKQTEDSVNLNLEAKYLVTPVDLKFTAMILLTSAQRIIASTSGGTANPLLDLLEPRVDNRIGVAGVTDPVDGTARVGTATNWFLFAAPAQAPVIEVGYLAGTGRVPQLRSFVLERGQYGIGWDCNMDIGAKALDYRGTYKATGAS